LRQQSPGLIKLKAEKELRIAKSIPPEMSMDEYYAKNGGKDKVLAELPKDLKNRILGSNAVIKTDNIYAESTSDEKASYFSNYFALGSDEDEKNIRVRSEDRKRGVAQTDTRSSVDSVSQDGPIGSSGGDGEIKQGVENKPIYERKSFGSTVTIPQRPEDGKSIVVAGETKKEEPPATSNKPPKNEGALAHKKDERVIVPTSNNSGVSGPMLTFTQTSSNNDYRDSRGGSSGTGEEDELAKLEKRKRDLEKQLDKINKEADELANRSDDSKDSNSDDAFTKEKQRLIDELNNLKRGDYNRNLKKKLANTNNGWSNTHNNFNNKFNNNYSSDNNRNFNGGYDRGREFDKEKSRQQLDDGGSDFDPEKKQVEESSASGGAAGASGKGKAKVAGGVALGASSQGEGDDEYSPNGANNKRKRKKGGYYDEEIRSKCGTGPILKCIFPNSYFADPEDSQRMYIIIANLRLEGRKFQTLEKVRPSKKEIRMGEKIKAKYYLLTYDVVLEKENREVTNDEREELYQEIKENRKNAAFKKKLVKIRYLTKIVPPKILLNDQEAIDAINRSITPEEYEQLGLMDD